MTELKQFFETYVCLPTYARDGKAKYPCVTHKSLKKTYFGRTKKNPNISIRKRNKGKKPSEREPEKVYTRKNIFEGDGFGIRTGKINKLLVVDLDMWVKEKHEAKNLRDGIKKYKSLIKKYNDGEDLETPTVQTKSGGRHIYFSYDDDIHGNRANVNKYTIDIRGHNGYVVVPPTQGYTWEKSIHDVEVMTIPKWLKKWIMKGFNSPRKSSKTSSKKKTTRTAHIERGDSKVDKKLRPFLELLKLQRFIDFEDWIRVGFIIYNEGGTCQLWDEFSKKAPNYGNVEPQWETFKDNPEGYKANFKTLRRMARDDNFKGYTKILATHENYIIDDLFENGANDTNLSHLFYSYMPHEYIYDNDNNELYKINKYGIYKKDTKDFRGLRKHIYDLLSSKLDHEFWQYYGEAEEKSKTVILDKFSKIRKFISKSRNKRIIADELCTLYGKNKLFEKLDNVNNYLLAFKNGVYDLKTHIFRKAKPEELITCTTGYKYKEASESHIKKVHKIIKSMFSNKQEREYVLKTLATGLLGENKYEEFYIWIGNGSNGKGVLRDMIKSVTGDYFSSLDIEYLCKNKFKKCATSADPIMAGLKNSRMVISTEPEGTAKLRTAQLKKLSGRDDVSPRDLYKSNFTFVPKFKMIIQTNQEVEIAGDDGGIQRRLRFITFRNKFVDNPTLKCHRQIDRDLKTKIRDERYVLAFLSILLEYYKKLDDKLEMPDTFQKETEEYLNKFDPIKRFVDERVEITGKSVDFVSTTNLYNAYIEFYRGDNKGKNRSNFSRIMKNKGFNRVRKRKANGYNKIKLIEDTNMFDD